MVDGVDAVVFDWALSRLYHQPQTAAWNLELMRTVRRLLVSSPTKARVAALVHLVKTSSDALPFAVSQAILEMVLEFIDDVAALRPWFEHPHIRIRTRALRLTWKHASRIVVQDIQDDPRGLTYQCVYDCVTSRFADLGVVYETCLDLCVGANPDMLEIVLHLFLNGEAKDGLFVFLQVIHHHHEAWQRLEPARYFSLPSASYGVEDWKTMMEIMSHVPREAFQHAPSGLYSLLAPRSSYFAQSLSARSLDFFLWYLRWLLEKLSQRQDIPLIHGVLPRVLGCISHLDEDVQVSLVPDLLSSLHHSGNHVVWRNTWAILDKMPLKVWEDPFHVSLAVLAYLDRGFYMWTRIPRGDLCVVKTLFAKMDPVLVKASLGNDTCPLRKVTRWIGCGGVEVDEIVTTLEACLKDQSPKMETEFVVWGCVELLQKHSSLVVTEVLRPCISAHLERLKHQEYDHALLSLVDAMAVAGPDAFALELANLARDTLMDGRIRNRSLSALLHCRSHRALVVSSIWSCLDDSHADFMLRIRTVRNLDNVPETLFKEFPDWIRDRLSQDDPTVMEGMTSWCFRLDDFKDVIVDLVKPYFLPSSEDMRWTFVRLLRRVSHEPLRAILYGFLSSGRDDAGWIKRLRLLRQFTIASLEDLVPDMIKILTTHPSSEVRQEALMTLTYSQTALILSSDVVRDYFIPLFHQNPPGHHEGTNALLLLKTIGTHVGKLPSGLLPTLLHVWKTWSMPSIVVLLIKLCPRTEQRGSIDFIMDLMEDMPIERLRPSGCLKYLKYLRTLTHDSPRVMELLAECESQG